jgi:hypothetical protein
MGQPVLLPPGMHSWTSETMMFKHLKLLDDHVITLGPYTIFTVDEGYSAITQNNGLQVVLDGGETHLLTHQKWRKGDLLNCNQRATNFFARSVGHPESLLTLTDLAL